MTEKRCKICDYPLGYVNPWGVCERDTQFKNITKEQAIAVKKKTNEIFCGNFNDDMAEALAQNILIQLKQKQNDQK